MTKQHRTGRSMVTLDAISWRISSATGRPWVSMSVYIDAHAIQNVAEGGEELTRIANEIREAAKEAIEIRDRNA